MSLEGKRITIGDQQYTVRSVAYAQGEAEFTFLLEDKDGKLWDRPMGVVGPAAKVVSEASAMPTAHRALSRYVEMSVFVPGIKNADGPIGAPSAGETFRQGFSAGFAWGRDGEPSLESVRLLKIAQRASAVESREARDIEVRARIDAQRKLGESLVEIDLLREQLRVSDSDRIPLRHDLEICAEERDMLRGRLERLQPLIKVLHAWEDVRNREGEHDRVDSDVLDTFANWQKLEAEQIDKDEGGDGPVVSLGDLIHDEAVKIATDAAFTHGQVHAYIRDADRSTWEPHGWVVQAVMKAANRARPSRAPAAVTAPNDAVCAANLLAANLRDGDYNDVDASAIGIVIDFVRSCAGPGQGVNAPPAPPRAARMTSDGALEILKTAHERMFGHRVIAPSQWIIDAVIEAADGVTVQAHPRRQVIAPPQAGRPTMTRDQAHALSVECLVRAYPTMHPDAAPVRDWVIDAVLKASEGAPVPELSPRGSFARLIGDAREEITHLKSRLAEQQKLLDARGEREDGDIAKVSDLTEQLRKATVELAAERSRHHETQNVLEALHVAERGRAEYLAARVIQVQKLLGIRPGTLTEGDGDLEQLISRHVIIVREDAGRRISNIARDRDEWMARCQRAIALPAEGRPTPPPGVTVDEEDDTVRVSIDDNGVTQHDGLAYLSKLLLWQRNTARRSLIVEHAEAERLQALISNLRATHGGT